MGINFFNQATFEVSELVHFRGRIGTPGMDLILNESIKGLAKMGMDPCWEQILQFKKKYITYQTDDKLNKKIIKQCQINSTLLQIITFI